MLIDKQELEVSESASIIGFSTEGGGAWKIWDRYLTVGGKNAYHIGNICNTCAFFFERLEGANQSVNAQEVADALNDGVSELNPSLVNALAKIVPSQKYQVLLQKVQPKSIRLGGDGDYFAHEQVDLWGVNGFWGLPHSPKIEYYRTVDLAVSPNELFYEFLVPMFPNTWLGAARINEYSDLLSNGKMPTAVAISVLDVKSPSDFEDGQEVTSHWCLTHYIIDGHHKVHAAALVKKPVTLISFLAIDRCISSAEEIEKMLAVLSNANHSLQPSQP